MRSLLSFLPSDLPSDGAGQPLVASSAVPLLVILLVLAAGCLLLVVSVRRRREQDDADWAQRQDEAPLRIDAPARGRLVLGQARGSLLATQPAHSVIVLGPTQSLKTAALAIPAILEWDGPVIATSVKTDLLTNTLGHRASVGNAWAYDPVNAAPFLRGTTAHIGWTPLAQCTTWQGAQRMATWLTETTHQAGSGLADGDFWAAAAAKLLAPLLHAAALGRATMPDVVRWVDTQERQEVEQLLLDYASVPALDAALATWGRDERQRSSIYTVAETALAPYADPGVATLCENARLLTPEQLLDGGASTLYLCAPGHEQARLAALFGTILREFLSAAFAQATRQGSPLDPPLLVVLDEAANIAPLRDLDAIAATAASHGIQLVSVFQDLAQVQARYGPRAQTVVNNHRAKVVLPGIGDPATLEYVSRLLGEKTVRQASTTRGGHQSHSTTVAPTRLPLAPSDVVRRQAPGCAILVYGHLRPVRLTLRPWFRDPELSARAMGTPPPQSARTGTCSAQPLHAPHVPAPTLFTNVQWRITALLRLMSHRHEAVATQATSPQESTNKDPNGVPTDGFSEDERGGGRRSA